MKILNPEGWEEKKNILVILAHPDDPEFFCGASIARWTAAGHTVSYCLLTRGDKGAPNREISPQELMRIREKEQCAAARILGVKLVRFLNYPDGYLCPDIEMRREIVRVIRQVKPDVVVTSDPTNYFPMDVRINHADHRAAGEATLGAVFPAAGNHLFFPELLETEGLDTVQIKEVWVTLTHQPNVAVDVSEFWDMKIKALHEHVSQIPDFAALDQRMRSRHTSDSTLEKPRYEDKFRRLILG